jgi:peptidoglycan hydrolase-like protein with peptidoglycan-binding domain
MPFYNRDKGGCKLKLWRPKNVLSGYIGRVAGVIGAAIALTVWLAMPASAAIGNLGPGSSGPQVQIWQQDLNFFIGMQNTCHPTLSVDGQYGTATTNATKCFQSLRGDSVDGIEGPMTRSSMCGYLDPRSPALYQETCS